MEPFAVIFPIMWSHKAIVLICVLLSSVFETRAFTEVAHLHVGNKRGLNVRKQSIPFDFGFSGVVDSTKLLYSFDPDTLIEAEVLNDLSHLALDFTTMLGIGGLSARVANVVGRLLLMASDFLPDHQIRTDEMIFQLPMLLIAFHAMAEAATPVLLSSLRAKPPPSARDGRAYKTLFAPAGFTWSKFKCVRHHSLEWTEVAPGSIIASDELSNDQRTDGCGKYAYWLYRGEVEIHSNLELVHTIQRRFNDSRPAGIGLIGEDRLFDSLNIFRYSQRKQDGRSRYAMTAKAGETGATLLRIDVSKVAQMAHSDEELAHAMRLLLLWGMQEKVHCHCYKLDELRI